MGGEFAVRWGVISTRETMLMSPGESGHASEWRIAIKGEQRGPYTVDQVRAMNAEGRLPADTLVWRPGMANWASLGSVPELAAPVSRGPAPAADAPAAAAAPAAMPTSVGVRPSGPSPVREFLAFRRMLTPVIIQIIFWLGIAACVLSAVGQLFMFGALGIVWAAITLVLGSIGVRIYCELLILLFRIHDTLQEIKDQRKQSTGK